MTTATQLVEGVTRVPLPIGIHGCRIEAIGRNKARRLAAVRELIEDHPSTLMEIADQLITSAMLKFQPNFALSETLSHIAYLRWSGVVERRSRPDGVYEWYAVDRASAMADGGLR